MPILISNTGLGGGLKVSGNSTGGFKAIYMPPPLLLDIYLNATAAYSLRKLRTAYTGNAIRVRRSSDNTETNIGFINNQIDITALLTFCGAGSGFVTTWYDQTILQEMGNAVQATTANQPRIVNAGALDTMNAKPTLVYSGTQALNTQGITKSQPTNYFLFGKNDGTTDKHFFDGLFARQLLGVSSGNLISYAGSVGTYGANITTPALYSTLFNGASSNIVRNGVSITVNPGTSAIQGIAVGQMIGNLSEFIFYGSNQTTNRVGIESNINSYYTIY